MKKLFIALLILLLLCGCANNEYEGNALLSEEKKQVFFKMNGKEYTNNDIFQLLKAQAVTAQLEPLIAKAMLESRNFDYESKKGEIEEAYYTLIDQYGEETVSMYFGTKEDYINQALETSDSTFLMQELIKEDIETYITKYNPICIELLITTSKSKANRFQSSAKKGADFTKTFNNQGLSNEKGDEVYDTVYSTSQPDLPTEVNDVVKTLTKENACSDVIEIVEEAQSEDTEDTYTYYVVRLKDEDVAKDRLEEFIGFVMSKEGLQSFIQLLDDSTVIEFYDDDFSYTFNQLKKQYTSAE